MSERFMSRASDEYTPRERLAAMVGRAELDPDGYGMELRADPVAALQRAGFSDADARALTSPERAEDPAAALRGACFDTTCIISLCPGTCFVSIPGIPGVCPGAGGGGGGGCNFFTFF
jgi:hypothetical protein